MTRIAVAVEYDGAGFHGWQTQESGVRTVQAISGRPKAHLGAPG